MSEAAQIKLIVFDVDGVLTDGRILIDGRGMESKSFYVRDGLAIRTAMAMGLKVGVLSGRASTCVTLRMSELGVALVSQGTKDKAIGLETICQQANVDLEQTAYVGDDLLDLPAMLRCGYAIAVADAVQEVREEARYVTSAAGGRGAARDAIEHILKTQGRWDEVVEQYGV